MARRLARMSIDINDPYFQEQAWNDPEWGAIWGPKTVTNMGGYVTGAYGEEFVKNKKFFDKQGQRMAKQNEAKLRAVQTKGAASAGGVRSILKGQANPPAQGSTILGGQNTAVKTLLGV